MILDFESSETTDFSADIVIVGSGAAGIALALELTDSNASILVLEAGGEETTDADQDILRCEIHNMPANGPLVGRARVLGGTTTLWGGQALPFNPIVFEDRPQLGIKGWPFGAETLVPYYGRVLRTMSLGEPHFGPTRWSDHGIAPPAFDPAKLETSFSMFSPVPNFATAHRNRIVEARNVRFLIHANVVHIRPQPDGGRIDSLEIRTHGGKRGTVTGGTFVLCAGGIETARLLLASNEEMPEGLGNHADWVGRCFQDHVGLFCGRMYPKDFHAFREVFTSFLDRGAKFFPKIVLSGELQRKMAVMDVGGQFTFEEADAGYNALKSVASAVRRRNLSAGTLRDTATLLRHLPSAVNAGYRAGVKKRSYVSRHSIKHLGVNVEQEPLPESRVTLSGERDALGMPRAIVDNHVSDKSRIAAKAYAETVAAEFERTGIGRFEPKYEILNDPSIFQRSFVDLNHHMGTTRMSDDPSEGVVDRDLRIHGIDNIRVLSCSVFPTGGYSNPTFSLLCLAMRLADQLRA